MPANASCMELNHSRTQALSRDGKNAEKGAVDRDRGHAFDALITMSYSEYQCLCSDGCGVVSSDGEKLLLQIAAENKFFAEPRRD